ARGTNRTEHPFASHVRGFSTRESARLPWTLVGVRVPGFMPLPPTPNAAETSPPDTAATPSARASSGTAPGPTARDRARRERILARCIAVLPNRRGCGSILQRPRGSPIGGRRGPLARGGIRVGVG